MDLSKLEQTLNELRTQYKNEQNPVKKEFIARRGKWLRKQYDRLREESTIRIYIPEELTQMACEVFGVKLEEGADSTKS